MYKAVFYTWIFQDCSSRAFRIDKPFRDTGKHASRWSQDAISVMSSYSLGYMIRDSFVLKWRQCKYLNNIVEQDHRFVKWRTMNMLGFKSFESAQITLSGIEIVRMIKKNQLKNPGITPFNSFCSLAN